MDKNNRKGEALKGLLSQNIRRFRELAGYSQEELAEKAGISLPFLGALERGEKWPSPSTLAGIAQGLEIAPHDLIKPENPASQDILKITSKLVKEINAAVNQSVKAINSVGSSYSKTEKPE
jgi:transcriptional regulator with XRE-family HTH domain